MIDPSDPLPLLPPDLLRRYSCAEPTDTRFRAVARLRQSLWRDQHGYPCGRFPDAAGRMRHVGSRVSRRVGRTGINLVDLTLVPLVQHEIAYREVGAVINVERLWTNLLTSQALTFSLFGPFKQNPSLATSVMRRLVPDLVGEVTDVRFEHSPGRGHPGFTADYTAFDVLIRCTTPRGQHAFVAIEMKYSEAPGGAASPERPRYDSLSRSAGVFREPDAPALRYAPIQQFWREQLLLTAMRERGLYDDGRLVVIAPALNAECQAAIGRYRTELVSDDPAETRFQAVSLEDFVAALGNRRRARHRGAGERALPRSRSGSLRPGGGFPNSVGGRLTVHSSNPSAPVDERPAAMRRVSRREFMSDDNTPPRHRGLIWLIFFFPGTVILWWQYYFPKHGDVWTSARRKDVPAMQFLYSLAFWAVAALMLLIFVASAVSNH